MNGKSWKRLLGEFAVIFVSILLALVADDWRETRSERQDGLDALVLIVEDLQEEAEGLTRFRGHLTDQAVAAAELIRLLEQRGDPVEIARAYSDVVLFYNYESAHPAYRGLAESGGLRLIEDATVREAIVEYHDGSVLYMDALRIAMEVDAQTLARIGHRHFARRPVPDDDGEFSMDQGWGFGLLSSPSQVVEDREFMGALGAAGASARYLAVRIDERFVVRNRQTAAVVRDYLARVGR